MPYKNLEARRACHRKSANKSKLHHLRKILRDRRYNRSWKGIAARTRYQMTEKGRIVNAEAARRYRARHRNDKARELAQLIADQERDARTYQIKHGPEFLDFGIVERYW